MLQLICLVIGAILLIIGIAEAIVWMIIVGIILLAIGGVLIFDDDLF